MRHPEESLRHSWLALLAVAGLGLSAQALAQTAVADDAPIVVETLSSTQLQDVVGPVALYPDDLLAVVLPASAYPLQIVQATRFLDELERDKDLKPDPAWDESIVALLNYPDVLRMMNDDLDWTYDLGAAVVNQQPDVIAAIETFRDRAYDAGNLRSDERQRVEREDDRIVITPIEREVIYVPYYEPERVVVVQRTPAYHYYPRPYPLYYYPYPAYYDFHRPYFFGVTSVFQIGWPSRHVNIHLWNYSSHPFYGRRYGNNYYYHHRYQPARYRYRPHANSRGRYVNARDRGYRGDQWRPVAQRNVRSLGQNRQRATRINRSDYVSSLKPRDPRERRLTTANSRTRAASTRSVAPKTRYRTGDATRSSRPDRVARANTAGTNTARTTNRQRSERTLTTTPSRPEATTARGYQRSSQPQTARAGEYRGTSPAVRERTRTTARPRATPAPASRQTAPRPRAQRAAPPTAARPTQRQSTAPAQQQRSQPSQVQRSQPRIKREGRSRSKGSDSARRDRR